MDRRIIRPTRLVAPLGPAEIRQDRLQTPRDRLLRKPITGIAGCGARGERPCRRAAEQRDEPTALHVWMAPAWQEKM
jgi:hypothetical protein